jgi:hypothetical protein
MKREEANSLHNLGIIYRKCGRVKESFAAFDESQTILQELDLPLASRLYPQWFESLFQFAQRGKIQYILCSIGGIIAFPFALIALIIILLWRLLSRYLPTS